jgi:HAD superfamily hydrolase (TIGR01493 family)
MIEVVTFDCANTLVEVTWTLDGFARDCMNRLKLVLPDQAYPRLLHLYVESLPEYEEINLQGNAEDGEMFWRRLTTQWFAEFGIADSWVLPSREISEQLMYGPEGGYFRLFPDTVRCLRQLRDQGIRLAVVSNWDYTLHRILETLGVRDRFELVLASLEHGVEKPDPRLFEICLAQMGVAPDRVAHVGDDAVDDVEGALNAGLTPIHLVRSGSTPLSEAPFASIEGRLLCQDKSGGRIGISSLDQLVEVVRSIG